MRRFFVFFTSMKPPLPFPKEPLTRNEKLTLLLSAVAIVVSVASPLAQYYWLQSSLREQAVKANGLQIVGSSSMTYLDRPKGGAIKHYRLHIENHATLPIKEVQIGVRYFGRGMSKADLKNVTSDTPIDYSLELKENAYFILSLKNSLAPGEAISLQVAAITALNHQFDTLPKPYVWVRSEATPNTQISMENFTGASW